MAYVHLPIHCSTNESAREVEMAQVFERLGCLLDIVHSKARQALKKKPPLPLFE
jgi:hypothetical protein